MPRASDLERQVREYWEVDAATYDRSPGHNPRTRVELAVWAATLRRLLPPPPARVLDAGAGTGFLSLLLAREGYRVTALDLAPGMLAQLSAKAQDRGLDVDIVEGNAADRDALLDDALIERGRGQGGSVRRVPAPPESFDESAKELAVGETATAYAHEAELYEPMRRVIETSWAKDHKTDPIAVVVTAAQGRRQTGGRWTKPDIVSVAVKTFHYLPGKLKGAIGPCGPLSHNKRGPGARPGNGESPEGVTSDESTKLWLDAPCDDRVPSLSPYRQYSTARRQLPEAG